MINTQELKSAIGLLSGIVPTRTTMPVLTNILMRSDGNGNINMSATDLEKSLTLCVKSDIEINHCVPAKELKSVVGFLTSREIDIKVKNNKIVILKKPGQATIRTISGDDFPTVEIPTDESILIDAKALKELIKTGSISALSEDSHITLCGFLFKLKNGVLEISSSDGRRLSTATKNIDKSLEFEVIVPDVSIKALIGTLQNQEIVNLSVTNNKVLLWNDTFIFTSQLTAGKFPDIQRIIPLEWETEIVTDKKLLSNAIKQSLVFSATESSIVNFICDGKQIVVQSNETAMGNNKTPIDDFEFNGKPINIFVNGLFVQDVLSTMQGNIRLCFNGDLSPVGLFVPEDNTITHIIMPIHLGRQ